MADNIQDQQDVQVNNDQAQQEASAAIAENMRQSVALFGGKTPENKEQQNNGQQEQNKDKQPENKPAVVTFDAFKEKYGYQTPEDAFKEIEELRASRDQYNSPTAIEDINFDNPVSEKLYRAIVGGKTKEVSAILAQQDRLDSLTSLEINKDNAADVIKFGMSLKYPNLSQKEIDYKFNKQFSLPKQPVKTEDEEDASFEARKAEWQEAVSDIETSKTIEAKLMLPELEAAKAKISLPEVQQNIDPEYQKWKESSQQEATNNQEIVNSYKGFSPDTIGMKINFKDEANKVDFNFDYKPDEKVFNQAVGMIADFNKFFAHFTKPDGTPDREGFLQAIVFAIDRQNIMTEGLKQAANGTIKSRLPDNDQGGLIRHLPGSEITQKNEVDELMKQSLAGWKR